MIELADRKARLRKSARAMRAAAHAAGGGGAALQAAAHFREHIDAGPHFRDYAASGAAQIVAGYWPVGVEFDTRPTLHDLARAGAAIALPVTVAAGKALIFRAWLLPGAAPPGAAHDVLPKLPARDIHDIPIPGNDAAVVEPGIILVPLLAFDRAGWRLGSGKGYYDITLAGLRRRGWTGVTVGFAFAAQEVPEVPHGAGDEPLDWIVTEREAIETGARTEI
jgi:5-formyltetrahydrofolate cyclo-ligase